MPKADRRKSNVRNWHKRREFLARMLSRSVHYIKDMDPVFDTDLPLRAIEMDFACYLAKGAPSPQRSSNTDIFATRKATAQPTKRSRRKAAK
jgi:hypothetical protein